MGRSQSKAAPPVPVARKKRESVCDAGVTCPKCGKSKWTYLNPDPWPPGVTLYGCENCTIVFTLENEGQMYIDMLIDAHRKKSAEQLREGLLTWWATVMGEVHAVMTKFDDDDSELFAAFGDEESDKRKCLLDRVLSLLSENPPVLAPKFLRTEIVTFPRRPE